MWLWVMTFLTDPRSIFIQVLNLHSIRLIYLCHGPRFEFVNREKKKKDLDEGVYESKVTKGPQTSL